MTVNVGLRIAAVLLWLNGVGFGVFAREPPKAGGTVPAVARM